MEDPPVERVSLRKDLKYLYHFPISNTEIQTFLVSAELSPRLGLEGIRLVAVAKIKYPKPDMPVLYKLEGKYHIDRLTYDEPSQLLLIEKGDNDFVFLTDVTVLGTPIGYCEHQKVNYKMLRFRKLPGLGDK